MGSSGDGGGGNPMLMAMMGGRAMPGLPIAGQGDTVDPFKYGKFQNFLPDIPAAGEGPAASATGLTSDMFKYRSPGGEVSGDTTSTSNDIQALRNELAKLQQGQGGGGGGGGSPPFGYNPFDSLSPGYSGQGWGGGGGGGGFGPAANGLAPPPGAMQLPTPPGGWGPGNVPGWPAGGPGTPIVRPGDNSDPVAAAAAAAAAKASGG